MGNLFGAIFINEVPVEAVTKSLKVALPVVDPPRGLVAVANTLQTPEALVELCITNNVSIDFLSDLHQLPTAFPNLKKLMLDNLDDLDLDREEMLFKTQFFTACDQTPLVDRTVYIPMIPIDNVDRFRAGIAALCEEQGVRAVYRKVIGQSWLTLNKGKGTIVIGRIEELEEEAEMSDSGEEDEDEDGEEEDGDEGEERIDFFCDLGQYKEEEDSDYVDDSDEDED